MWWWWVLAARAGETETVAAPEPAMRGHFEKATTAMLATALGQMDVARTSAKELGATVGLPPTLVPIAESLAKCGKVACATEQVGAMGQACADCHLETGHGPTPRNLTTIPGTTTREKHIYAATFHQLDRRRVDQGWLAHVKKLAAEAERDSAR